MIIDFPTDSLLPSLKKLWKEGFGDDDGFVDDFFSHGFSKKRALSATESGKLAGALYWFDMEHSSGKIAYVYGVATAKAFRGKGIGSLIMKEAERLLKSHGYSFITLVPAEKEVISFYEKLGYRICANVDEINISASDKALSCSQVAPSDYFAQRRKYTDKNCPALTNEAFSFLASQVDFYIGDDFVSAVRKDSKDFFAVEFLGNTDKCSDFIKTLGYKKGTARLKGTGIPFAMYLSLSDDKNPPFSYLGFAFD